jgi:hypothetical protein
MFFLFVVWRRSPVWSLPRLPFLGDILMIIKDKPLHILSAQFIQCAYFYPAGVLGCATRPYGVCTLDHIRRFPDFIKLEAYQVRLSSILVDRYMDFQYYRASGDWSHSPEFRAHLKAMRSAGVL